MIAKVIRIANFYDRAGLTQKADRLDAFIQKWAQAGKEPTEQDLMAEEEWLQNEDLSDQALLEGLEGEDLEQMQAYLSALQETQIEDLQREQKQKQILDELSNLMIQQPQPRPDLLPKQQPIIPEASLSQDFAKLADLLDHHGLTRQADFLDRYLKKIAGPEDENDEFDHDFHDQGFEDELGEPSTDELMKIEEETSDLEGESMGRMISFISQMAEGGYATLEEAVMDAREVLDFYDQAYGIFDEGESADGPLPENVIPFPES